MNEPVRKKNRPKLEIYITPRDIEVMEALWRYRIMRESTLHRLGFPMVKHQRKVQGRLKKLWKCGYIGRWFPPIVHRANKTDAQTNGQGGIYWIERRGVEEVLNGGERWDNAQRDRVRSTRRLFTRRDFPNLKHPLDVADVRACLEVALARTPGVLLAAWYEENLSLRFKVKILRPEKKKEDPFTLCPDGCFVLEDAHTEQQQLFFVEIDEGTESARKRWRDKVLAYVAYWNQGFEADFGFKGEGFRVLTVTRSEKGKKQAAHKVRLLATTYRAGGRGQFWIATFDQVMPEGIVTGEHFLTKSIWQRAREEDVKRNLEVVLYNELFP